MGNSTYRLTGNDPDNVAPAHDPKDNTIIISEGSSQWIVKETDVPGVYRSAVSLLTFNIQ